MRQALRRLAHRCLYLTRRRPACGHDRPADPTSGHAYRHLEVHDITAVFPQPGGD